MGHGIHFSSMKTRLSKKAPERPGKRYSVELPLDLAARLEALFEMHPGTPRSHLMADLLRLGVAEVQRTHAGEDLAHGFALVDSRQPIYLLSGPFAEFHKLLYKHHLALERAKNKEDASEPNTNAGYQLGDTVGLE
jgi:hypothetical protein